MAARIKELVSRYGKVAVVVHLSESAASYSACYSAIKNNVDVNEILQRIGLLSKPHHASELPEGTVLENISKREVTEQLDHAAVKVLNEGGAFCIGVLVQQGFAPCACALDAGLLPGHGHV